MELLQALYTTRAMRRVTTEPTSDEIMAKLLDAAVRAPSGGNTQKWRFLILTDPAKKTALQKIYSEALTDLNATQYKPMMDLIANGDLVARRSGREKLRKTAISPDQIGQDMRSVSAG